MDLLIYMLGPGLLLWSGWNSLAIVLLVFIVYTQFLKSEKPLDVPSDFHVVIVGAGVSGICMGKKLKEMGIKFTILEKGSSLGGTWHDNLYPGCACDVPSHLYSYSFFLNPSWSQNYSKQPEILAYLQRTAARFGVTPNIRFGERIVVNTWDKVTSRWRVVTESGLQLTANIIISGSGALHVPKIPEFPGAETFRGEAFHTAQWRKGYDPRGKRVAIIGTGASAVQAVPNLARLGVTSLTVFQRTPAWSPPRLDYSYPSWVRAMFSWIPLTNTIHRYFIFWRNEIRYKFIFDSTSILSKIMSPLIHKLVRAHIRKAVKDPETAKKLTPSYDMGCKRITPSDDYLQAFNRSEVSLVTEAIMEVTEDGIKTKDGVIHEADTILYATGFDVDKSLQPYKQIGLSEEIQELSPYAYYGMTHPEHPNFFVLLGPGTGLGHNSIIFMIECQVNYAADAITKMINTGAKSMVLKPEILKNYIEYVKQHMTGKVFGDKSTVASWYKNEAGVNWTLWPLDLVTYWWGTLACDMDLYFVRY